jgi:hypothetical protein
MMIKVLLAFFGLTLFCGAIVSVLVSVYQFLAMLGSVRPERKPICRF